jgi:hypothetical protein
MNFNITNATAGAKGLSGVTSLLNAKQNTTMAPAL